MYGSLDLGIYAQVFWNTSYGRFFEFSIHSSSYLGDHFEPMILLLTPLYMLWRDPRMLLMLQIIVVHLAAIPLWAVAKNIFIKNKNIQYPYVLATLIVIIYLLNPLVQNALAFEFHLLPFFILPFFIALYFAEQGRWWPTFISLMTVLLVREDMAFVIALFGLTAYLIFPKVKQQSAKRWIGIPLLISFLWLIASLIIISHFSPNGEYKFAIYYGALRGESGATITNIIKTPFVLIQNLFRPQNLEMMIGLLIPVAFLPLIRPTALVLGALPFLEFALSRTKVLQVLSLHYGILFTPALIISTIFSLCYLFSFRPKITLYNKWPFELGIICLTASTIYGMLTLGPIMGQNIERGHQQVLNFGKQSILKNIIQTIDDKEGVVSSNNILPHLANRESLYSLRYILAGRQQFSVEPYIVPDPVQYLIVDEYDIDRPIWMKESDKMWLVSDEDKYYNLEKFIQEKKLRLIKEAAGVKLYAL